jgi:hypothetical protein
MSTNTPNQILNRIPSKLKPLPIKIDVGAGFTQEYADGLGHIPLIWYNAYPIEPPDMKFFELSIIDGLPSIKITLSDTISIMRDRGFPLDDTRISLFINPRSDLLKPIHMDFKITEFKMMGRTCDLTGVLDVNKLYIKEFVAYRNLSSYELFKKICSDIGFGFNSNVESSNDTMTWINPGKKVLQFMQDTLDNCYISDKSFILGYFDFYYNYNYVDIQKELSRDIKDQKSTVDTGVQRILGTPQKNDLQPLTLTNDVSFEESNLYFDKYTVINKSSEVSLQKGYKSVIKYYNQIAKEYLLFNVDSITDNTNTKIILKGKPKDNKFRNENLDFIYKGKIDTDNSHINYLYSAIQNDRNITDVEKVGLEIEMKTPNYNLYRFQKVLVAISNQSKGVIDEFFNARLSGEWLVIDIKFRLIDAKYRQILTLVKRELELSKNEKK